jgi:hypothetical protein
LNRLTLLFEPRDFQTLQTSFLSRLDKPKIFFSLSPTYLTARSDQVSRTLPPPTVKVSLASLAGFSPTEIVPQSEFSDRSERKTRRHRQNQKQKTFGEELAHSPAHYCLREAARIAATR